MAMSSQEKFEYWLDAAQYDLRTAEALLDKGIWPYVVFMCQQSIEKLVKGLYILYLDDNVPKIHSIGTLVGYFEDELPVEVPEETVKLFVKLSRYYLNNRYPDYKAELGSQIKKPEAEALYAQTKEVFAWLLTLKP